MEEIRYARGDTTRTPTHRWEDNIRMHLREIRREVLDWIHLAQGRDQWRDLMKKSNEPSHYIKGTYLLEKDCALWSE
jgi:hypothetical protein